MGRFSSTYVCQQCGYTSMGYMGKCPECSNWNTLVETVIESSKSSESKSKRSTNANIKTQKLSNVSASDTNRISTNISELDRVLGGGLIKGQAILIAGEPGIGKSTLLTQVANSLKNVLYVCGEESPSQIAVRAKRMGINANEIELLDSTDVDSINHLIGTDSNKYSAIIVDSIQTITTSDLSGMAGSVGQVRESASRLVRAAKESNIPLFLVGHVTKEGTVAGPAVLAHVVDTVLWFEGDKTYTTRILRAVKNRFGPTDEVGIFEMIDTGLKSIDEVENLFLEKTKNNVAGSVVTSIMQGTRPILVEIQALVVPTKLPIPRRVGQGIDNKRLEMLLAVLTRRCGIPLYEQDVFVNVAGGIKVTEPASDLAICLAIASAHFDKPVLAKTLAIGEVGLLGEIRSVASQEKRLKEARRLGYKGVISSNEFKYLSQIIKDLFK